DILGDVADAQVFVAQKHGGSSPADMVAAAWDLVAVESAYEEVIVEFDPDRAHDPLARIIELVHAWRRFPWTDPEFPPELLPTPWRGAEAARRFADRPATWSPAARAEWVALDQG